MICTDITAVTFATLLNYTQTNETRDKLDNELEKNLCQ